MVDGEPAASVRYLKASLLHWILPQNEASENCALDYGGDDTLHGKDVCSPVTVVPYTAKPETDKQQGKDYEQGVVARPRNSKSSFVSADRDRKWWDQPRLTIHLAGIVMICSAMFLAYYLLSTNAIVRGSAN